MAKPGSKRSAEWRRRLLLKSSIFDDLNAERAARIRQAFPGDDRPEVRAVIEFFANYPRCQNAPNTIYQPQDGIWVVCMPDTATLLEHAAAEIAMQEVTSIKVAVIPTRPSSTHWKQVRDEVAEMRALGLWGRS